jgi:hypothetical protein
MHQPGHLTKVVALRVHLDQSSEDDGSLPLLPGGALSDAQIEELVTNSTTMTCTVPVGSILAMRALLVHSSSKSHIDLPRRVLHFEYATSLSLSEGFELAVDQETRPLFHSSHPTPFLP